MNVNHVVECEEAFSSDPFYETRVADADCCMMCRALRACEQRVLDAALEAVDTLRQSNYTGWEPWMLAGVCVDKTLAAIDALRGETK